MWHHAIVPVFNENRALCRAILLLFWLSALDSMASEAACPLACPCVASDMLHAMPFIALCVPFIAL